MPKPMPKTPGQKAAATKAAKKAAAAPTKPVKKPAAAPAKATPAPKAAPKAVKASKPADKSGTANRRDLAESIRESLKEQGLALSEKVAIAAVEAYEDAVATFLVNSRDVVLPGFGKFRTTVRAGGLRRNPSNGETITVGDMVVASFKPGSALKQALNT